MALCFPPQGVDQKKKSPGQVGLKTAPLNELKSLGISRTVSTKLTSFITCTYTQGTQGPKVLGCKMEGIKHQGKGQI